MNSVVNWIINPLVGTFSTKDPAGYSSCLKGPCVANDRGETTSGIHILWGSALRATLTFLITAAVVCLMVLPTACLARRAGRQQPAHVVGPAKGEVEEITLLRGIRDALVAPRSGGTR